MSRKFNALPKANKKSWKYLVKRIGGAIPQELATVAGATAAVIAGVTTNGFPNWAVFVLVVVLLICIITGFIKIKSVIAGDDLNNEDYLQDGFHAALNVVRIVVSEHDAEYLKKEQVRVALYRVIPPVERPKEIEQMFDTLGGEKGTCGRIFPVGQGITGRAIRTHEPITLHRPIDNTENDYIQHLKKEYGYTDSTAREVAKDRYSLMAVPIRSGDNKNVIAVLYVDSKNVDVFDDDRCYKIVFNCAAGIQKYISERWNI